MENEHGQQNHHVHDFRCDCVCHQDHKCDDQKTSTRQSSNDVQSIYENPAIYSVRFELHCDHPVNPDSVEEKLTQWIDDIRYWAQGRNFLIGHIKVFVESKENLWLACTKQIISRKQSSAWSSTLISKAAINATAIILGTTKEELEQVAKGRWERVVEDLES